jgi:hypothetical protein
MNNFVAQHRRLFATLFVVVVICLCGLVFAVTANTNKLTTPSVNKDTQTGDDDSQAFLTYKNSLYSITADPKDPHKLTITAFAGYRNAAVNKLYEFGLNPADYKITFNYESPFKRYE